MRRFTRSRMGQLAALSALATVGIFAASPLASADGLLPTITTVTASVPDVTVPGSTTLTGTTETVTVIGTPGSTSTQTVTQPTGTQTSSGGGSGSGNSSGSGAGRTGQVDAGTSGAGSSASGAASNTNKTTIRLANGTVSVSASSLRAPTRLLIYRLAYSPRTLRRARAGQLHFTVQIRDTARHVVRGVVLSVRGRGSSSRAVASTRMDGTAAVYLAIPATTVRVGHSLTIVLRAAARALSTQRTVRVPIKS
jgi:hypothetical protein